MKIEKLTYNSNVIGYDKDDDFEDEEADDQYELRQKLYKLVKRCERCKFRFKCYTQNTADRPEQLKGINFEVAKCCIRCTHGHFRRGKDQYRRVGKCSIHKVSVHQFSYCDNFNPKRVDNLTYVVYDEIKKEMEFLTPNFGLPRYCIVDKKHLEVKYG